MFIQSSLPHLSLSKPICALSHISRSQGVHSHDCCVRLQTLCDMSKNPRTSLSCLWCANMHRKTKPRRFMVLEDTESLIDTIMLSHLGNFKYEATCYMSPPSFTCPYEIHFRSVYVKSDNVVLVCRICFHFPQAISKCLVVSSVVQKRLLH